MANSKSWKWLTVSVSFALLASIVMFLLTFLLKEPSKISAELPIPPNSVSVGK